MTIHDGYEYACPYCGHPNRFPHFIGAGLTIKCGKCDKVFNPSGEVRHGSPTFYKLLEEMADTHDRKSHDYASNDNPCGNYHFAGKMAVLFSHSPEDAGFVGRLAEKIYRIANLENGGKTPKNESLEDTERDIAVIAALWMADRRARREFRLNKESK